MSSLPCHPRLQTSGVIEDGTIGSYPLVCDAWACFNVEDLLALTLRGENYLAPGFDGRTARGIKLDQHVASLRFEFDGVNDRTGSPHPDLLSGLELNRRDFITNVVKPPASPSTRVLSLTLADGTVVEGDVQVTRFDWTYVQVPGMARAIVEITVPAGELVEPTSP